VEYHVGGTHVPMYDVKRYPAEVIQAARITAKGVKFRIRYHKNGRMLTSWVQARKLVKR
jgi:hypothetical protein